MAMMKKRLGKRISTTAKSAPQARANMVRQNTTRTPQRVKAAAKTLKPAATLGPAKKRFRANALSRARKR